MIRIQSHQSNILNCPECCTPVYRPMFKTHMLNSHKNVIESKWIRCPKCPSYLPTYFKRRQHLMIEHDYFQCEVCFMEYQTFPGILFVYILFFRCLFNLDIIKFSFFSEIGSIQDLSFPIKNKRPLIGRLDIGWPIRGLFCEQNLEIMS